MQKRKLGKQNRSYTKDNSKLDKAAKEKTKEFIAQQALEALETEENCSYKCCYKTLLQDVKE